MKQPMLKLLSLVFLASVSAASWGAYTFVGVVHYRDGASAKYTFTVPDNYPLKPGTNVISALGHLSSFTGTVTDGSVGMARFVNKSNVGGMLSFVVGDMRRIDTTTSLLDFRLYDRTDTVTLPNQSTEDRISNVTWTPRLYIAHTSHSSSEIESSSTVSPRATFRVYGPLTTPVPTASRPNYVVCDTVHYADGSSISFSGIIPGSSRLGAGMNYGIRFERLHITARAALLKKPAIKHGQYRRHPTLAISTSRHGPSQFTLNGFSVVATSEGEPKYTQVDFSETYVLYVPWMHGMPTKMYRATSTDKHLVQVGNSDTALQCVSH